MKTKKKNYFYRWEQVIISELINFEIESPQSTTAQFVLLVEELAQSFGVTGLSPKNRNKLIKEAHKELLAIYHDADLQCEIEQEENTTSSKQEVTK